MAKTQVMKSLVEKLELVEEDDRSLTRKYKAELQEVLDGMKYNDIFQG